VQTELVIKSFFPMIYSTHTFIFEFESRLTSTYTKVVATHEHSKILAKEKVNPGLSDFVNCGKQFCNEPFKKLILMH